MPAACLLRQGHSVCHCQSTAVSESGYTQGRELQSHLPHERSQYSPFWPTPLMSMFWCAAAVPPPLANRPTGRPSLRLIVDRDHDSCHNLFHLVCPECSDSLHQPLRRHTPDLQEVGSRICLEAVSIGRWNQEVVELLDEAVLPTGERDDDAHRRRVEGRRTDHNGRPISL